MVNNIIINEIIAIIVDSDNDLTNGLQDEIQTPPQSWIVKGRSLFNNDSSTENVQDDNVILESL